MSLPDTTGASFERAWAAIERLAEQQNERAKKSDAEMEELRKRTAETQESQEKLTTAIYLLIDEIKEDIKDLRASRKRFDREMGKLSQRFGDIIEEIFKPNLAKKFKKLGFEFERENLRVKIESDGKIILELDIFLENGDSVMVVEVKSHPTERDVTELVNRIKRLREYLDARNDHRKIYGAIGGMKISRNVKEYTMVNGMYVIEPSGRSVRICETSSDFHASYW
ncbi:MAG: hypothetical protein LBU65_12745 [Planctomycetaceae bacterium]|jgi:hypothetical protein|nr:hypothetical protein [Planctomycetaceae bacterium]